MTTTPAQRLAQFARFCSCEGTEHPYLGEDYDTEQAQSACASDINAVLRAAHSLAWMAKRYAEAGGTEGPEMREFEKAMDVFAQ